jgi:uncharacterized protein (DUF58 family)
MEVNLEEMTLLKKEESTTRRVSERTFSLLIGNCWLILTVILVAVSFMINQVPLLLVSLLFFFTGGIARLWEHYCLSRVDYRRKLSSDRAFFGDEIYLDMAVSNRKPLPLPWFHLEEEISEDINLLKGIVSPSYREKRATISNFISLGWYNRITRRYPILCDRRGLFVFGPTILRSGDIFGIFNREIRITQEHFLMVYPKIVQIEELGIPSRQLFGDIRTRSHILEDPILTLGVRDYHFGDSMKRIHWKASARTRKLQTKVFELTTTTDVALFLDVRTTRPAVFGSVPDLLELVIITAASIANYTITAGYKTGLYVNQRKRFPDEPMRVPPGQHTDQMMHILESLSQATPFEAMQISRLIQNETRNLAWGSTIVVITAMPTDALLTTLHNMKRSGRKVVLVTVGGDKPPKVSGNLTVYHVREDISWRDLESISIGRN